MSTSAPIAFLSRIGGVLVALPPLEGCRCEVCPDDVCETGYGCPEIDTEEPAA